MQKLFAAIDAEPVRKPSVTSPHLDRHRAVLCQPVAAHAGLVGRRGRLALLLQAGVIGAVLMGGQTYQTASLSLNEPARRR